MQPYPLEIQDLAPTTRTQSLTPGNHHKPLNQTHRMGADTKNNGNYDHAGCENKTSNKVS